MAGDNSEPIVNRRSVLKTIGVTALGSGGVGLSSAKGSGGNGGSLPNGNGPPGKSCEDCPDGTDELFAKYEFEDGEFVFEKGDDVVDITYEYDDDTYNKDGEKGEPNFIEFEADGYVIQHVCVYGGRDTEEGSDDGGLTEFSSNLENPGGQEAAISNVVFCGIEEPDPVYWQVDFGLGSEPPEPPFYSEKEEEFVMAAVGNSDRVSFNPSCFVENEDVDVVDEEFEFDDEDDPTKVKVTFDVDVGSGEERDLHLAVFTRPPNDLSEFEEDGNCLLDEEDEELGIDEQELIEVDSGSFGPGKDSLEIDLPIPSDP